MNLRTDRLRDEGVWIALVQINAQLMSQVGGLQAAENKDPGYHLFINHTFIKINISLYCVNSPYSRCPPSLRARKEGWEKK